MSTKFENLSIEFSNTINYSIRKILSEKMEKTLKELNIDKDTIIEIAKEKSENLERYINDNLDIKITHATNAEGNRVEVAIKDENHDNQ